MIIALIFVLVLVLVAFWPAAATCAFPAAAATYPYAFSSHRRVPVPARPTGLLPGARYTERMPLRLSGLRRQTKKPAIAGRGAAVPGRVRFSPVVLVQEIESCLG